MQNLKLSGKVHLTRGDGVVEHLSISSSHARISLYIYTRTLLIPHLCVIDADLIIRGFTTLSLHAFSFSCIPYFEMTSSG